MFKKKNQDFLIEEPVNKEKKSAKKIFIDVVGIFIVISLIVGTFLVIKNHEKIFSSLPISTDEDGKLVLGRKKTTTTSKSTELVKPDSQNTVSQKARDVNIEIADFDTTETKDAFVFTVIISTTKKEFSDMVYCEKMAVDGFEISNTFEVEIEGAVSVKVDIRIDKTELAQYEITKPNEIDFFLRTGEEIEKGRFPFKAKLNIIYYAPMDNSIKDLLVIGEEANTVLSFYKQEEDIENTYIYFDVKNTQIKNLTNIKLKKLIINDKLYEDADVNEDVYYSTEKLFYIKIPRKEIPNVKNFTVSFFIISGTENESQEIYITKEFTHSE